MSEQITVSARAKIARHLHSYTPREETMSPDQWAKASEVAKLAILATDLPSVDSARAHMAALLKFLTAPTGWDERGTPQLSALLTEEAITSFAAQASPASRRVVASRLRRIARAVGAMNNVVRFPSNRHVTAKPRRDLLDATNCGLVVFTHVHDLVFGRPLTEGMIDGLATHIKSRRCATAPKNESGTVEGVSRDVVTAVPNLVPALEAVPERLTPATRKTGKKQTSKSAQLQASRANRKALAKATAPIDLAAAASIEDLDAEIRKHGQAYAPESSRVSPELWERLRELTLRLTAGYAPATTVQFTTVANAVVTFLAWVTQLPGRGGQTPTPEELVDEHLVEEYIEVLITHLDGGRSPETTRTRLRRAVRSLRATPAHITLPGRKLATPYSPAECARMCQLVEHQNAVRKQNLAFVLALGLGAGIAAREFRHITRGQIIAHPRGGFDVEIRNGNYPRTIPVRTHYVPLLTGALEQFDSNKENTTTNLLIGTNPDRKHFLDPNSRTLKVADGRNTVIDMNRLRTTWLFAMMNAPIPLASLLYLAGLSSARTLAELLRFCPPPRAANVRAVITELKDTGFDLGEVAK